MAITVKHTKVSTIPDDADTSLVRPSDWNADHALTGVIDVANGGTGASTASGGLNNLLPSQTSNTGKVLTTDGTNASWATNGSGTVTSVGGTGTVSGIALSGTVTSSGNLTLGGTLDLSSPPTIGNTVPSTGAFTTLTSTGGAVNGTIGATTPAAGTFTTLTSSGTATLANGSTTYVTVTGDASYPMIKATGGTNTPLVLSPLGTGALQAQKTDSTATGGNVRGANAVDWQTSRSGATQVASGSYSVLGGGISSLASGAVSGVFAGNACQATNFNTAVLGGTANVASGINSSVVGGNGNLATGWYGFVGNGFTNSTTATAAVTTQSGTMNATTAVTLSGSNASIKVGQYITGTSIASDTYVAAISGTALTLSKVASGSSTSTLSFYTPHGVVVGGGNNQATGSYSFIGGGGDAGVAANRNVASGAWSTVVGGAKNTASGISSFVGGGGTDGAGNYFANTASGINSVITGGWNNLASGAWATVAGGQSNQATNSLASIGGGTNNLANSYGSTVVGGTYGTTRGVAGYTVFAASQSPISTSIYGASQAALLVLGVQTTDATATVLRSDTNAAGTTNQVILPNNSAYYFRGEVISGKTAGGDSKGWTIEGVIKRGANAAATTLVGSTVTSLYADAGAATWTIGLTADTTNGGLTVTFTGQAATTIRTVCQIRTTEMTY